MRSERDGLTRRPITVTDVLVSTACSKKGQSPAGPPNAAQVVMLSPDGMDADGKPTLPTAAVIRAFESGPDADGAGDGLTIKIPCPDKCTNKARSRTRSRTIPHTISLTFGSPLTISVHLRPPSRPAGGA